MDGQRLKEYGQQKVLGHNQDWQEAALEALRFLANKKEPFTAETLKPLIPNPAHVNAYGALFSKAVSLGIIRRVGYESAKFKQAHGRIIAVWIGV